MARASLDLYKKFAFLLHEREALDTLLLDCEIKGNRIKLYQETIEKIKEMPFEIRLNMFLIECESLNHRECLIGGDQSGYQIIV